MEEIVIRQGYQISPEELHQIQQIQIELICEVDRICKKHRIRYNMVGGTMLGAVRHKGYIPWDDDADIGFLREEYEKFRGICKTELDPEKYYIQDFRDTEGYRWGYGKLRRKGTEFIRLNQEFMPYEQGISIDLMPFDNVPDSTIGKRIHFLTCFIYRKIFWSAVGRKSENHTGKRILYRMLYRIPEKILIRSYQKFIDRCNKKETSQVRILTFPTPKGVFGYERRWYTELAEYEFEEYMLPGAADYDGYLQVKYKNYMDCPPVEKRKTHPVSKLTLLS
jgi:lipopolysaccharide cholinephosphotransferase